MGVNTPWCPRCGAWRGYVAALCKGCTTIDNSITTDMLVQKRDELVAAAQTPEQKATFETLDPTVHGPDEGKLRTLVLRDLVQKRFVKISEMRTDREAFTQTLEEMVEQNVDVLKAVAMDWMRMRAESRRVRFSNMFAMEVIVVARQALEQVGALSLELAGYTENKARHEEIMQAVAYGMQTVEKFVNPDANEPDDPPQEQEEDAGDDLPPGAQS